MKSLARRDRASKPEPYLQRRTKARGNGEGSIYQRADGRWCASLSLEWGKRKVLYGISREEVHAKLTRALANLQGGQAPPDLRISVGQYFGHWLDVAVKPPAQRPETYRGYEANVRLHILPYLAKFSLAKLQPYHIERWMLALRAKGLSPRTVQYCHAVLRAGLQHALRQGLVQRNVAKLVEGPKLERPEVEILEPEQVVRVLEAVRGDRFEAFYVLAITTGLRRGELLGLRWADIDLERAEIRIRKQLQAGQHVELKTGRKGWRTIAISPRALQALREHRARQLKDGELWLGQDLLFCSEAGTPMNASNLWRHTAALLKRAGIPHHRLHIYRHTFASLQLAEGAELHEVSKLLGHSGIQITNDTYGHLTRSARHAAAARIDRALGG
jgi:integrase